MRFRLEGWDAGETAHGDDVSFRTAVELDAPCDGELVFDGLATLCDVVVDGSVAAAVRVHVGPGAGAGRPPGGTRSRSSATR